MQHVINATTRLVYGLWPRDHVTDTIIELLHCLTVAQTPLVQFDVDLLYNNLNQLYNRSATNPGKNIDFMFADFLDLSYRNDPDKIWAADVADLRSTSVRRP